MELYGRTFSENEKHIAVRRIYCKAMEELRKRSSESGFYKRYWEYGSIPVMFKNANHDLYQIFLKDAVQFILHALQVGKVYDYDATRIIKVYSKYAVHYLAACHDAYAEYCDIQGDLQAAKQARSRAKETRGRFVGGGFGLSGTAKGIAMAGAANLATGALYSAGNLIGNTISKVSASSRSDKLYTSHQTAKKLYDALCKDFLMGVDALEEIFVSELGPVYENPLDTQRIDRAKAIMKNIETGVIPAAEQQKMLVDTMLDDAPHYDELYLFAYRKFGDDNGSLLEFAKLFGKNDIIERIQKKIADDKREAEEDALEQTLFGENYAAAQVAIGIDGNFSEFTAYYIDALIGQYLNKDYADILKELCSRGSIPELFQEDLIIFAAPSDQTHQANIQKYIALCDREGLFQSEEVAYCFINRGVTSKDAKGILITSKGIYFSPSCKSEISFMAYDNIDGIVSASLGQNEFIYKKRRTTPAFAAIDEEVACLLTLTVLYFKYGEISITKKLVTNIVTASEKVVAKKDEVRSKREEAAANIASKLIVLALFAGIIAIVLKMCGS